MKLGTLAQYGTLGVVTYGTISSCTLVAIAYAIENQINVEAPLKRMGLLPEFLSQDSSWNDVVPFCYLGLKASSLATALIVNKFLFPIKMPLAVIITPKILNFTKSIKFTPYTSSYRNKYNIKK